MSVLPHYSQVGVEVTAPHMASVDTLECSGGLEKGYLVSPRGRVEIEAPH